MTTEFLCTLAVAMAGVSLTLSVASLLGQNSSEASSARNPAVPKQAVLSERPSLKLSRGQLLEIARSLGIGNARWRNSARKTELLEAITAHNKTRRVAHG